MNAPIGIFDSGVGGLHVLAALRRRLPGRDMIYLGDTARLPYGNKSVASLRAYAHACVQRLVAEGAEAVVVACNTAAAAAAPLLGELGSVPLFGVVDAGAQAAVEASMGGRIGVVATHSTIDSGCFAAAIGKLAPRMRVWGQACPVWVALAEAQMGSHPATALICADDLAPLMAQRIDTLLLGCTHFPLLAPAIAQAVGPNVRVVDGAAALAAQVAAALGAAAVGQAEGPRPRGHCRLLTTDSCPRLWAVAQQTLGAELAPPEIIHLETPLAMPPCAIPRRAAGG